MRIAFSVTTAPQFFRLMETFFSVKPVITKNDSKKYIRLQESDSISLPCVINHSSPTPTVSWWIQTCSTPCNPSPRGWTRMETADTSSLRIPPSNDHALYKCTAENLMGYDDLIYTVTRQPGRCRKGVTSTSNRFFSASHFSWSAFSGFVILTNRFSSSKEHHVSLFSVRPFRFLSISTWNLINEI